MNKKIVFSLVVLGLLSVSGVLLYYRLDSSRSEVKNFQTNLIYDPSDIKQVVGAHHYIFTGKVLKKLDPTPYDAIPQTQYLVEVVYNVKGQLTGEVTVSQLDDFVYPGDKAPIPALQVGSSYLFATRFNPDMNWHVLSAHSSGVKLLTQDAELDNKKLLEMSEHDLTVRDFKHAYQYEIIPSIDSVSGNARNAYRDLK